jgi:hypothetical protein
MDSLTSGIVGLQQASLMSKIQVSVAKRVLDHQKMQGAAAVQLIEAASKGVAQAGDALVAAATGLGSQMDVYG